MRVTVHFVDGERLVGEAEHVSLERGGFSLTGTGGNTRAAWVGAGAIKYIVVHAAFEETYDRDPREESGLTRVVLHFLDGEILRSYRDSAYAEQPGGFVLRLFDGESRTLQKALVPGSSLKGVFVVDQWDSRTPAEKETRSGPRRRPAERLEPKPEPEPGPEPQSEPDLELEPEPEPGPAPEPRPEPEAEPAEVVAVATAEVEEVALPYDPPLPPPTEAEETTAAGAEAPVPGGAVVLASHYDPEERRQGFVPGLARRRRPQEDSALTPDQERHLALRLRISEVLGALGPEGPEEDAQT